MQTRVDLPAVSAAVMRQIDELATSTYQIRLIQMMENAGRGLARLIREQVLAGSAAGGKILVLAGPGGNGGGGMAAARRLRGWGAKVWIALATPPGQLATISRHQLSALEALSVPLLEVDDPWPIVDGVVDALLGYSAVGAPRPPMGEMILKANRSAAPIVALDVPTGIDPDSGLAREPAVRASATLTLALPKSGLLTAVAADFIGDLWLADIGLPTELYAELDLAVPDALFAEDDLIPLFGGSTG